MTGYEWKGAWSPLSWRAWRPWLALAALCAVFFAPSPAHAEEDIGSVTTSDVTDTSFVVHWQMPDGYEDPSQFQLCIKKVGSLATPCDGLFGVFWHWDKDDIDHTLRSYPVPGMDPGQDYKIKVVCYGCAKKKKHHWWHFWPYETKHKVGETTVTTGPQSPTRLEAALWVSAVDATHITVSWRWFPPPGGAQPTSRLHLCYKERWWPTILGPCKNGEIDSNALLITDYLNATSQTISYLSPFTNYKIYLVDDDRVVGEVKAQTLHH